MPKQDTTGQNTYAIPCKAVKRLNVGLQEFLVNTTVDQLIL